MQTKKENIRNIILASAKDLFLEKGYSNVTMREIAHIAETQVSADYFSIMKRKYPELITTFSHFFIHTMCAWWITIIEEIISHHRITSEEIEQFISEYIRFATAGWKELMNA